MARETTSSPPTAWARIDARAWTGDEQRTLEEAIYGLRPVLDGARLTVTGGITRPPMIRDDAAKALAARAIEIARGLGQQVGENASGGGSDGNFAAAVGTPVLDGLGPLGAGAHADDERVSLQLDRRAGRPGRGAAAPALMRVTATVSVASLMPGLPRSRIVRP